MDDSIHFQEDRLVFLETFGCQMNENDSDRMLGFLKDIRYRPTSEPEKADLILINTCSVRDKAEQKVYSAVGRFKGLKKERPGLLIGVSGCVAQQEGEAILKRAPYVDMVFGPHNIHKIKDIIAEASGRKKVVAIEQSDSIGLDEYSVSQSSDGLKAFVSIMRGCDNFCSYCIVPYTRGREVSRKSADIIAEIEGFARSGVAEVTLLGQNVNSYGTGGAGDASFPELLGLAAKIDGIKRIRFITSHPKDISDELITLFGKKKKLCRHLHLPVQSGSDAVLERMGRGYTREAYQEKVNRLKGLYPDMAITTDIIVGFPGETESDFNDTMELLKTVRFDNIFSFMYSQRPGTKASSMDGQLDFETKSKRLQALQEAQREITLEKSKALAGKKTEVLVEGPSKGNADDLTGRTSCNRIVHFPASKGVNRGDMIEVTITDAFPNSLRAVY